MTLKTANNESNNRGESVLIHLLHEIWLGMRDSNPRSWDQNPVPYHLANPQYKMKLY